MLEDVVKEAVAGHYIIGHQHMINNECLYNCNVHVFKVSGNVQGCLIHHHCKMGDHKETLYI